MDHWKFRAVSLLLMLILVVSLTITGYVQDISPDEASTIYKEVKGYYNGLIVEGKVEPTAFNMFIDFAPVVLLCNTPFVGPLTTLYLAYNAGYTVKAEYVAMRQDTLVSLFMDPVNLLQLLALTLAGSEGILLSYMFLRRERIEALETLAVIILEISLTVLSVVLEAIEALF